MRKLDESRLADHMDRLYRAARALCGSREEAEDLVQESYARVLARPRFLRSEDDLGYLLSVLRNTFLSEQRTRRRRAVTRPLEEVLELADHRPLPADEAEAQLVYQAIASLGEEFRSVLVAVDVVGLSYREAGRTLGVREGTVMSRLFRARQRVAEALADERLPVANTGSRRAPSTRPA